MFVKTLQKNSSFVKMGLMLLIFYFLFFESRQATSIKPDYIPSVLIFIGYFIIIYFLKKSAFYLQNNFTLLILTVWIITFSVHASNLMIGCCFLFTTLSVIKLIEIDQFKFKGVESFDLGILLFFASIAFLPNLFLLFLIVLFYTFTKSMYPRSTLLFLLGFLTVALLFFQITILFFEEWSLFYKIKWEEFCVAVPKFNFSHWFLLPIVVLFMIAMFDFYKKFVRRRSELKQPYSIIALFSAIYFVIFLFFGDNKWEILLNLSLPFSIILGRFIHYCNKSWQKEGVLWVYILSMVFYFLEIKYSMIEGF